MRRAAKVDDNHTAVVNALRHAGCMVESLAAVGKGVPDLLVGRSGTWYVMEVKDGAKPASRRQLTPDQKAWHDKAWAKGLQVLVVNSPTEAVLAITEDRW